MEPPQGRYTDTDAADTDAISGVSAASGALQPPVRLDTEQERIGAGLPRGYTACTMDDGLSWTEDTLALHHGADRYLSLIHISEPTRPY